MKLFSQVSLVTFNLQITQGKNTDIWLVTLVQLCHGFVTVSILEYFCFFLQSLKAPVETGKYIFNL